MKSSFVVVLTIAVITGLAACGIRGAPIPPRDPNLYYNDYQKDVLKKEREDEQKNKFRRRYSPGDSIQK